MRLPSRAAVLGLARSGEAAASALERRGVKVVRLDRRLGDDTDPTLLDGVELLVKSPGVPSQHVLAAEARRRGIPLWSEVELGYRLLRNPIVGVTGTNGKTTTCELLGAIFRAAGREVAVAGNIGHALTALDGALATDAWIVCELSSFQLEDVVAFRPRVAVLLNLEADHLDRHGTFGDYRDAKLRVFENQLQADSAVVPRGFDPVPGLARRVEFAAADALPAEPRIPGTHNRENAVAAAAAARAAGIEDEPISEALRSFSGVEHRLELVAEVAGARYVNDSKATNVAAAQRALLTYKDDPVRLILGGSSKHESFEPLSRAIGPNVIRAYLVGEAADELAAALGKARIPYERAGDLESAVLAATRDTAPGEVVLLSPACASYDQFENFERRGEEFKRLVRSLGG